MWKYISVLCVVVFYAQHTYSFQNSKQIEKPVIKFLSKSEGMDAILDETYEMYFSQLQHKEVEVMLGEKVSRTKSTSEVREYAKEKFSSAVDYFSVREKSCITFVVKSITTILNEKELFLFTQQKWKFIKTESWLCGGFAHTRGEYIILSQKHLDHLSKDWGPKMNELNYKNLILKMGSLLVHEQIHCTQRMNPQIFNRLYTDNWGFKKICVESNNYIKTNQLSNPDAPKPEWAYYHDEKLYWIRTLINSNVKNPIMGKDLIDAVFILESDNKCYKVKKDSLNKETQCRLDKLDFYSDKFPVTQGLDHPNEISAYMFSEYFKSIYIDSIPFKNCSEKSSENSIKFVTWIEKEFH